MLRRMSADQSFNQKKIGEGSWRISFFIKKIILGGGRLTKVHCVGKHSLEKYVILLSLEVTRYTFMAL